MREELRSQPTLPLELLQSSRSAELGGFQLVCHGSALFFLVNSRTSLENILKKSVALLKWMWSFSTMNVCDARLRA
eukprot:scaffold1964_cov302-Pinguiococcus_pyrenoidosus.AAC.6